MRERAIVVVGAAHGADGAAGIACWLVCSPVQCAARLIVSQIGWLLEGDNVFWCCGSFVTKLEGMQDWFLFFHHQTHNTALSTFLYSCLSLTLLDHLLLWSLTNTTS